MNPRTLNQNLTHLIKSLGFTLETIPGRNGQCLYWAGQIKIGRSIKGIDRAITLAHELGHVFDYTANFPALDEVVYILEFWPDYAVGDTYYRREVSAWRHARGILRKLGAWEGIAEEFERERSTSLAAYRARCRKYRGTGPSPKELARAKATIQARLSKSREK